MSSFDNSDVDISKHTVVAEFGQFMMDIGGSASWFGVHNFQCANPDHRMVGQKENTTSPVIASMVTIRMPVMDMGASTIRNNGKVQFDLYCSVPRRRRREL